MKQSDLGIKNISGTQMSRSINFFGLLALGIGCMFGTSWLLVSGHWLGLAGGPKNVILGFILCIIVELPLAFAYLEAIPMMPLSGGELVYSYVAFGSFGGFFAAWAGILMNGIILCWETVAVTKIMAYLIPQITNATVLYEVGGFAITFPNLLVGLGIVILTTFIQYRGAQISASVAKVLTVTIVVLAIVGIIAGFTQFDMSNLMSESTKSTFEGSVSLLAILTFTIAGWETVAKSAGEAKSDIGRAKVGKALIVCLLFCVALNILIVIAISGIAPWQESIKNGIPFADVLVAATGLPILSKVLLIAALVGVIGVSNATFYGATRMLHGLAKVGLIPKAFAYIHPKYKTPTNCILFIAAFAAATPFIGKTAFIPLIDVTALATVAMWIMTFFAVIKLRKKYPDMERPVKMPGGKLTMVLGTIFSIFILGTILLPMSPGRLAWPSEYILSLALFLLGLFLYTFRDKSISEEKRAEMLLGEAEEQFKN